MIEVEVWEVISLIVGMFVSLLGFIAAAGKILLWQIDKRLNERFKPIEKDLKGWSKLEREFLDFKADMPLHYVRREDYVRNQTVIEAKLDALAMIFQKPSS